ncbi:DDE superfamily endonuclease domain-containing protein [Phthorimaea operculella]|nr:DDE superfamily endonuclease domain-containing protein [Phthorimaea operculella]
MYDSDYKWLGDFAFGHSRILAKVTSSAPFNPLYGSKHEDFINLNACSLCGFYCNASFVPTALRGVNVRMMFLIVRTFIEGRQRETMSLNPELKNKKKKSVMPQGTTLNCPKQVKLRWPSVYILPYGIIPQGTTDPQTSPMASPLFVTELTSTSKVTLAQFEHLYGCSGPSLSWIAIITKDTKTKLNLGVLMPDIKDVLDLSEIDPTQNINVKGCQVRYYSNASPIKEVGTTIVRYRYFFCFSSLGAEFTPSLFLKPTHTWPFSDFFLYLDLKTYLHAKFQVNTTIGSGLGGLASAVQDVSFTGRAAAYYLDEYPLVIPHNYGSHNLIQSFCLGHLVYEKTRCTLMSVQLNIKLKLRINPILPMGVVKFTNPPSKCGRYRMPNQYVRTSTERGKWTQQDLLDAVDAVVVRNVSVRQASIEYGVPRKTLERRLKTSNFSKGPMGPSSVFGEENEKGWKRLRSIAYYFAEQLKLNHSFNKEKEEAGYVWLQSFLKRNPEISIRKSEGVSLARCEALNREEVNAYYDILYKILEDYDLFDKPSHIFNMDESGFQLNNRPGHVLAKKGSKAVSTVTSTEKGETITVIACCNAEGVFLPPACIMKGKNKKQEWQDGMPPGSVLYMSQKSAYINAAIFFEWLKTHFLPRKPAGKVLLCLDGHTSHCNSVEMLEFAAANDICLFTLPSHTTHYLQTLDRSVFKSLKAHYYEACRMWLKLNPGRRLTRLQFGELLSTAWGKGATYENATAGFKATGVYPFNRSAVPDYAFSVIATAN